MSPRSSTLAAGLRVTASQVGVAGTSYVALALSGRALDAGAFAALSSFYLVLNVVGRGLLSASELELTRATAAAGADLAQARSAARAGVRHTVVLTAVALAALLLASPVLLRAMGDDVVLLVLLGAAMPGMAAGYALRGPLAGTLRYGPYAASFVLEAGVIALGALLALASGSHDARVWALGMAVGPLAGVAAVAWTLRAPVRAVLRASASAGGVGSRVGELVAAVVVLGCAQAVWNVPPVLLTADSPDVTIAAGFAAVAIVLRAPVMLFPGLQALLLPALAARPGSLPRLPGRVLVGACGAVVVWLVAAVALTPVIVHVVIGPLPVPAAWVLLALAVATVLGGVAQLLQTALVAMRRQTATALAWTVAMVALGLLTAVTPASPGWAAVGLLTGVVVATCAFALLLTRSRRSPAPVDSLARG